MKKFGVIVLFAILCCSSAAQADMRNVAQACSWDFGRGDGSVIAENIKLASGGKIVGYKQENEDSWGIERGYIVFRNQHGIVSTKFDNAKMENNRLVLFGTFLLHGNTIHTLTCR